MFSRVKVTPPTSEDFIVAEAEAAAARATADQRIDEFKVGTEPVFMGYTMDELEFAFRKVQPRDWKDPIDATIYPEGLEIVKAAIMFFTATHATVDRYGLAHGVRVTADGYRKGPAGDH